MTTETEIPAEETPEHEAAAQADAEMDMEREIDLAAAETELDGAVEGADTSENATLGVEELQAEVTDLKDKLLRAMADAENTRRIAAREKTDASKYAVTNFARDILRVADFLNMATMAVTDEARKADQSLDNLCVGIDMTMKELLNVFEAQGIKPIKTDGPFDHNLHEAVSQEENPDVPKGTILRVQRSGFTIQGRLLRPAQVIVATGGPKVDGGANGEAGEAPGEQALEEPPTEGGQQAYGPGEAEPGQKVDQET